jgi:FKBP-type peptidyl-prolyl cis-trans isomerase SlyD
MKVGNSMVVSIEYTLKGEDGEVIESNVGHEPLVYLHGTSSIIEGLEDGLDELENGESFDIIVDPKNGYGKHDRTKIKMMNKDQFPADQKLEIGQVFTANSPDGPSQIKIIEITDDEVKVDGNHEFAGKTLNFTGKVLDVREGTPDELGQGHIHGPDCHH